MKEFKDLTPSETKEVFEKANYWYQKRIGHVSMLAYDEKYSYPPLGSDLFHPELWKGGHWKWFLQRMEVWSEL